MRVVDDVGGDKVGEQYAERISHKADGGGESALILAEPSAGDYGGKEHDKRVGEGGDGLPDDADGKAAFFGEP